MQKTSITMIAILLFVQILSNGFAQIPSQSDEDSWQGPVLESGARSVGVLTDTQQQSILNNQTYNGSNDNDGDGVVNNLDSDDDNDCIPDSNDSSPLDFDGDGINDESDIDDDGDGLNDSLEVSDSNASTNIYDADNDGNHDCAFFSSGGNNTGGNNTGGNNTGGNNTGGNNTGGNNSNQMTYNAYQLQYCFSTAEDIEIFMNINGLNATEFYLEWEITSGSTIVASGSPLISVNSNGTVSYTWTFNSSALNTGVYTVMLNPADSGLGNLFSNSPFYYNIEVGCNNTGGNNTGGNNTAGNNQTNPIMPVNCSQINWDAGPSNVTIDDCWNQTNSFWFFFNQSGVSVWIDPVVAVGYDYVVYSGPSIVSVEIPLGYGDDVFDLYFYGTNGWYDSNIDIDGGVPYTFSTPVERMSIRGIEASEMLDPNDPTAFVTALTFQNSGTVLMTMTPVTENYTVLTCGNDPSMTDLMIWTDAQSYPQGTTVYSDYYVNCSVNTKDYELHVFAYSTSGGAWSDFSVWNWTETDSHESMDDSWSNLAQGTYCVNATLYMVSGGAYQFVDFEVTCFTVTGNSSGGGGSTPLDPCGLNSSYTQVWSWMDASTYANGDDQDATFYVNCTRTGADYTLEYYVFEVGSSNYVLSGMYTWVANSININFYDTFTGLGPGDYCVLANLYEANVFLTDNGGTTCFTITGTAVNSPPTISYTLQIPVAYSGDALDCYAQGATYSDPDNDPDQSIFTWNVNNVQISTGILNNIIPAGSFVVGDIVHCEAIAHDGMAQGNTMNRYYFVQPANNTAPSVSNVLITPPSPIETDTLTCSYTYSDPDMDPDASLIQWSINGVAVPGATTDTLSSGYATADFITCTVTAFDGTVNGNTGTMSILIMSSGSSSGGGLPAIGVVGTIAAIAIGFIFTTRREDEE
ncbi:hypothetical protein OAM96_00885 [Candidatus Poseidoniaceae archaeon]|nr:hypothetical protein [Candidatus Poseidoniaceae archaeon]